MKRDLRPTVIKMTKLLDKYKPDDKMEKLLDCLSLDSMKNNSETKCSYIRSRNKKKIPQKEHFVDDHKNLISSEQSAMQNKLGVTFEDSFDCC